MNFDRGGVTLVEIVGAAASKHEGVHTHAQVMSLRVDTFPHEHTASFHIVDGARLWIDLKT